MLILQIEHEVLNFYAWKKAFEADPVNRKKSGVLGYKVFQRADNPNYVLVHLEFDNLKDAEDTLTALRKLWEKIDGKIMISPQTRILNLVEAKVL
jgi:ribosomal protein L35AE/L33A